MEEWKDIPGYEGLYQISSLGRIKSLYYGKERILKTNLNSRGYVRIPLHKNNQKKSYFVHRLVATAFIENKLNKEVVNHLDCNPLNNRVDNLEWCTQKENMEYMSYLGRSDKTKEWINKIQKSNSKYYKPVVQKDFNGKIIKIFPRLNAVSEDGFRPGDVCRCCKNIRHIAGGYKWEYLNL